MNVLQFYQHALEDFGESMPITLRQLQTIPIFYKSVGSLEADGIAKDCINILTEYGILSKVSPSYYSINPIKHVITSGLSNEIDATDI